MSELRCTVPLPPTVNHQYIKAGRRVVLSDAARGFREVAVVQLRNTAQLTGWQPRIRGRYALTLVLYFPNRRSSRDLDNRCKAAQDAINHAFPEWDDGQIDELRIKRGGIDRDAPRCEVVLVEVSD